MTKVSRWIFGFLAFCAISVGVLRAQDLTGTLTRLLSIVATAALVLLGGSVAGQSALKIIVIDGENAVNVIQLRTAVAPVVEVRDRNDQPVAGAIVRFAVTRGQATFSGARTITVTTNAAGRAAATGFAPTGVGTLQLTASASFQGQTIAATIAQTNVMTAAEAATATSAAGSSGAGGGAAGGGGAGGAGGGLSATTVGIIGGAAAGGAIVAKETVFSSSGPAYAGSWGGTINVVSTPFNLPGSCSNALSYEQTLTVHLTEENGTVSGDARSNGTSGFISSTCGGTGPFNREEDDWEEKRPISGTAASISFGIDIDYPQPNNVGSQVGTFRFVGSLSGDTITGTMSVSIVGNFPDHRSVGAANFPVTLRKQ